MITGDTTQSVDKKEKIRFGELLISKGLLSSRELTDEIGRAHV